MQLTNLKQLLVAFGQDVLLYIFEVISFRLIGWKRLRESNNEVVALLSQRGPSAVQEFGREIALSQDTTVAMLMKANNLQNN